MLKFHFHIEVIHRILTLCETGCMEYTGEDLIYYKGRKHDLAQIRCCGDSKMEEITSSPTIAKDSMCVGIEMNKLLIYNYLGGQNWGSIE